MRHSTISFCSTFGTRITPPVMIAIIMHAGPVIAQRGGAREKRRKLKYMQNYKLETEHY